METIGAWQKLKSAPRDGTEIMLTWMHMGASQDCFPMRWEAETGNPIAQDGLGIWVMRCRLSGKILMTWSEADPDSAPTHWRRIFVQ